MLPTHRKPTHPGEVLREEFLLPHNITQKEFAERLGISTHTLSDIIRERGRISPEIALRLSRFWGTTPNFWLHLQQQVDLWSVSQSKNESLSAIQPFH
jgi:addiction module HigA family antidote